MVHKKNIFLVIFLYIDKLPKISFFCVPFLCYEYINQNTITIGGIIISINIHSNFLISLPFSGIHIKTLFLNKYITKHIMIILFIWTLIILIALYLWLGRVIYEDINSYYRLNLIYTIIVIFLWPLFVPIMLITSQVSNVYYIIKNAYYKQKHM